MCLLISYYLWYWLALPSGLAVFSISHHYNLFPCTLFMHFQFIVQILDLLVACQFFLNLSIWPWYILLYFLKARGQHLNVRHLYSIPSHWNLHIIRQQKQLWENGSHANSGPKRSIHTMKQRIYLIYLTIWVLRLVCGCQVFCEDLNSNSVSKLFILIWSYEGMKVMNFSEQLSITLNKT